MLKESNKRENKLRIREREGTKELFCLIRKKWILSTAEEIVRQSTILHLLRLGYSEGAIAVEIGFKLSSGKNLRADIVVYNIKGEAEILVECKAKEIAIDQEVFRQASKYNTFFKAKYIILTNGLSTHIFFTENLTDYTAIKSIPIICY